MLTSEQYLHNLAISAAVTAGRLDLGTGLARISLLLGIVGLILWQSGQPVNQPLLLAALALALALVQGYFALRVRFDANIFRIWACRWGQQSDPTADLAAFDRQVGRQKTPLARIDDELARRRKGALHLLHRQIGCVVMQVITMTITLWH